MWTDENRYLHERRGARVPCDLTDEEWALIAPLIPPAKHGGRKAGGSRRSTFGISSRQSMLFTESRTIHTDQELHG